MRFYYDDACRLCIGAVGLLSRLDTKRRVRWTPYKSLERPPDGLMQGDMTESAWLDSGERLYRGFYAFRELAGRLPLLRPLSWVLWLPGLDLVGDASYRWIARRRYAISRFLGVSREAGRMIFCSLRPRR